MRQFLHPLVTLNFPEEMSCTFLASHLAEFHGTEKADGIALWCGSAFQTGDEEK